MLLIYGDLTRATWYFIFAIASFRGGAILTQSPFCQASGFLIQYGTETSGLKSTENISSSLLRVQIDYTVLIIAIHSAIQVFRPSVSVRSDVFYRQRYYIYAGGLTMPVLMAGLAFVNPTAGYISNGAFCSLPLRPYWYRLALVWIPRYLTGFIILGLAVAIYTHVGFVFRAFTKAADRFTLVSTSTTIPTSVAVESRTATGSSIYWKQSDTPGQESEDPSSFIKQELDRTRRASGVISIAETTNSKSSSADRQITSSPPPQPSNAPEHNDRGQVRSSITSVSTAYTANMGRTITFDSDAQIFPALAIPLNHVG